MSTSYYLACAAHRQCVGIGTSSGGPMADAYVIAAFIEDHCACPLNDPMGLKDALIVLNEAESDDYDNVEDDLAAARKYEMGPPRRRQETEA